MKALTIAGKDLKVLLRSPMFFLIAGLCSFAWSILYIMYFSQYLQRSFRMGQEGLNIHNFLFAQHIGMTNLILLFAVPAITMRLIAEEKKLRTYDLLLTSPVTAFDISVGKVLAGWGASLVLLLISFLYPLGTSFLVGDFYYGPLLSSYLGLVLVAGVYCSVGLFASSLSESAVLSVVLAVIMNISLWFLGQSAQMSDNPMLTPMLEQVSLPIQFADFVRGNLQLSAAVFFVSCMGLFVFLTDRVVESARWR